MPIPLEAPAILLGDAAALVEDEDGGRVFLHGNLVYAWASGESAAPSVRRPTGPAGGRPPLGQVAAAFAVDATTVWRWGQTLTEDGVAGPAWGRRGAKGRTGSPQRSAPGPTP